MGKQYVLFQCPGTCGASLRVEVTETNVGTIVTIRCPICKTIGNVDIPGKQPVHIAEEVMKAFLEIDNSGGFTRH
jgi:hypothetical protein